MIIRPLYPIYGRFPRKKHMQFLGFEKHFLKTEKYPIQPHLPTSELLIQQKDSPVTGGCPIWKIIHNTFNKDWLVVEPPTPLKNDGVSSSVGMIIPFPTEWKVINSMVPNHQPAIGDVNIDSWAIMALIPKKKIKANWANAHRRRSEAPRWETTLRLWWSHGPKWFL